MGDASWMRMGVASVACWCGAALADPPPDAPGGDLPGGDPIATGGVEEVIELAVPAAAGAAPRTLPGVETGPRTERPATEQPESDGRAEWFGQAPPWEWTRLTGDWAGARPALEKQGITFAGGLIIEWGDAISGGMARKWVSRNALDLNLTVETEPLLGWNGGTFYVDFQSWDTTDGGTFLPVYQWSSGIEIAGSSQQVGNLWYEQTLLDGAVRAKFGKIDSTLEFGFFNCIAGFLNLYTLYPATFASAPTFPYAGLGGLVYAYPCEHWYIGAGAFNSSFDVTKFLASDQFDEIWAVGETGLTWDAIGPFRDGRIAFGGWWDSTERERFDGEGDTTVYGLYALGEWRLWQPEGVDDDLRGLWLFGGWSVSVRPHRESGSRQAGFLESHAAGSRARRNASPSTALRGSGMLRYSARRSSRSRTYANGSASCSRALWITVSHAAIALPPSALPAKSQMV
jgi:hypothetical protein